jgi:hypothetical protein
VGAAVIVPTEPKLDDPKTMVTGSKAVIFKFEVIVLFLFNKDHDVFPRLITFIISSVLVMAICLIPSILSRPIDDT